MFCELTNCSKIISSRKIVLRLSEDRLWIGSLVTWQQWSSPVWS